MPLTIWNFVLSSRQEKSYFSEKRLVLQRNYFHNRIPGSIIFWATLNFNRWHMEIFGGKFATCYFKFRTLSLVIVSLKFQKLVSEICQYF